MSRHGSLGSEVSGGWASRIADRRVLFSSSRISLYCHSAHRVSDGGIGFFRNFTQESPTAETDESVDHVFISGNDLSQFYFTLTTGTRGTENNSQTVSLQITDSNGVTYLK